MNRLDGAMPSRWEGVADEELEVEEIVGKFSELR